ncbi:MAG: hypothetical protein PF692_14520 [Kiritimatiellae bacterium]|jgi:hypothetical protein|nr:hypothetical protein [Kiritimatiellia bacterium]
MNRSKMHIKYAGVMITGILCLLFTGNVTLQAQTWNGSGGNGNWSVDANWDGAVAPVSSNVTDLVFDGSTQLSVNNDISDPFLLNNITFPATAGNFILSGDALELYGDIINQASGVQTIVNDIELAADSTWTIDAGEVVFSGNMISNTSLFTLDGPGTLTLTGNNALYLKDEGIKGDATLCIQDGTTTHYGSGSQDLFTTSGGQTFVITNGAKFVSMVDPLVKYENSAIVSGSGSVWDGNGTATLFMRTDGNLLVTDGAIVTNFAELHYGGGSYRINMAVTDGGKLYADSASFYQGRSDNTLTIGGTNAAGEKAIVTIASGPFSFGSTYTCSNNKLLVDADGELNLYDDLVLGYGWGGIGTNNAMIITNGGQVVSDASTYDTRIGSNSSSSNYVHVTGVHPVTGLPSMWDVGGTVWLCYQNSNKGNKITASNGGVITNVEILVGETRTNGDGTPYAARVEILNGGIVYGKLNLGYAGSENTALISGGGATLDSQDNTLVVGYQVNADNNILTVDGEGVSGGAVITNADYIYVGYINNKVNKYVYGNSMIITNGGHVYADNDLYIGYVSNATATNETANNNSVAVSGNGSLLDMNNQPVRVGHIDNDISYGTNNGLIAADYGVITNVGSILTGYTRVGGVASNNYICAAGGSIYATDMTLYSSNILKVVLGPQSPEEFGCINISNDATFESDTTLLPVAEDGAQVGTYTILVADGTLDAAGLTLDSSVDQARWNLSTDDNTIKLTYSTPGSVIIIQ